MKFINSNFLTLLKNFYLWVKRSLFTESEQIKKYLLIRDMNDAMIKKMIGDRSIVVLNGPFKGMKYISSANGSQLIPKILGSYEEPIHFWINQILNDRSYTKILDVGCAEGYYAIGFALSIHKPKVIAFDIDLDALVNLQKLAEINGVVDQVDARKKFEPSFVTQILEQESAQKILIFMDVEGAEADLLDTKQYSSLLACDVLVELHDCFSYGLTERIINYFSNTHKIHIVVDYPWRSHKYDTGDCKLKDEELKFCFDEMRPKGMRWMFAQRQ